MATSQTGRTAIVSIDILKEKGVPLERQRFTWRELAGATISKLDDDAFTRVRVILMNGIEAESVGFSHQCARMNNGLRLPLADIRRVEHHQQTVVNWLLSPDHSPLETTIAYEQTAIEVTAHLAQHEPDPYLAQTYRFGLLEDFDHLYAYSALLDRLEGKDANNILQSYTDIRPGRPTMVHHRAPADDLRTPYDCAKAAPLSKLFALTLLAGEQQTRNYYMNIGPVFADPVARQLYAEIASVEEQHVTQYESIIDPSETWMEKWLLHEATEVWNYWSCAQNEDNKRIKGIWERFLDYELGHLHAAIALFEQIERRDAAEVLPATLPDPLRYQSHREFVRNTLADEADLRAAGATYIRAAEGESERTIAYRTQMNDDGSPSNLVSAGYRWRPGTELVELANILADERNVQP
jgi:rubrerythrin